MDPLRIGIMLRGIDEVDGVGVYIRKLCDALLSLDAPDEFILFYQRAAQLGRYADRPHVTERLVPARSRLWWDQVAVPRAARRARLDVLFHHKFSIPLFAPCPTVVQQRSSEYWLFPKSYDWLNTTYNRLAIPIYCKRATLVLTNSDALADDLTPYIGIPRDRIHTVYAAADPDFAPVTDTAELERVRAAYRLPAGEYILMVVKGYARVGGSTRTLFPGKNIDTILAAYSALRARRPDTPPLVMVGSGLTESLLDGLVRDADRPHVHIPGYIAHADMAAVYSRARVLVFASRYESFGIPIVEAMACGCPVITSDIGACREVAGDAAIFVQPDRPDSVADAMERVVADDALAHSLRGRGRARAAHFSWTESATRLLQELHAARGR
jgi:glycosyltransferase involved in cell wall biosynthesis